MISLKMKTLPRKNLPDLQRCVQFRKIAKKYLITPPYRGRGKGVEEEGALINIPLSEYEEPSHLS